MHLASHGYAVTNKNEKIIKLNLERKFRICKHFFLKILTLLDTLGYNERNAIESACEGLVHEAVGKGHLEISYVIDFNYFLFSFFLNYLKLKS